MGTDYVVSVTANNECGNESPLSEEITVRIDLQGTIIFYMCMYANHNNNIIVVGMAMACGKQ